MLFETDTKFLATFNLLYAAGKSMNDFKENRRTSRLWGMLGR